MSGRRVFITRHASAGVPGAHPGPDHERPLDPRGLRQAAALHDWLAAHGVDGAGAVLSSPYPRCRQTVEPLASALDLEVAHDDALVEGSRAGDVLALLRRCGPAVLCSHGDVIGDLLVHLQVAGLDLGPGARCEKASTWVLDLDPDGTPTAALYLDPPA